MSAFVDLYSALWGAVFGSERYAIRKQQDGQSSGFNDDDPRHGFGKGKGELLFQEQRLPPPPPAPVDRNAPFESIAWSIREHQNPINGVRHWDVRHPARPDTTIGAGSSRDFAIQNAKRLWAGGYEFWPEEPEQYAGRRPSAGQLSLFGDDQKPAPSREPETGLVPAGTATPAGKPARLPPLHVIAEVRDHEGNLLGYEHEPHDGTPEGIRAANTAIRDRLEDLHPTWSNIATRTGATDSTGHPAWAVSPNSRNVYPTGSQEAQDLLGWTSTPRPKLPG